MRDLEIRGAGNLLGTKQSGHISQIGFALYCQLLRQSVDRLKGRKDAPTHDATFKADFLVTTETAWLKQSTIQHSTSNISSLHPCSDDPSPTSRGVRKVSRPRHCLLFETGRPRRAVSAFYPVFVHQLATFS